jgi:hypothetical protein
MSGPLDVRTSRPTVDRIHFLTNRRAELTITLQGSRRAKASVGTEAVRRGDGWLLEPSVLCGLQERERADRRCTRDDVTTPVPSDVPPPHVSTFAGGRRTLSEQRPQFKPPSQCSGTRSWRAPSASSTSTMAQRFCHWFGRTCRTPSIDRSPTSSARGFTASCSRGPTPLTSRGPSFATTGWRASTAARRSRETAAGSSPGTRTARSEASGSPATCSPNR